MPNLLTVKQTSTEPKAMPDLIVIIGPPASGKAAVGLALSQSTGFRFFHNHMTAEPAAALFGWGTEAYGEAADEIRLSLLTRALAQPLMPSIIFTFFWVFDQAKDNCFVAKLVDLFEAKGQRVFFVELIASLETRVAREGTPLRLALKPSKHDVERAKAFHAEADAKYQMNSCNDFPYPARHVVINTEKQSPAESAEMVIRHFGLSRNA
jgi:hypothetical protein